MPTVTIGENTGNTYSGTIDTKLREPDPTTNYGSDTEYKIDKYATNQWTHGVIAFPGLSNITGPVTVSAASLFLRLNQSNGSFTWTITAKRLLRNWVEAEATWNVYSIGNSWTTAGGTSDGNDRSGTVSGTFSIPDTAQGIYYEMTSAQLATDVQGFINGTFSNYGWHLERTDGFDDAEWTEWVSSEGTDTLRPYLSVTYTASSVGKAGHYYAMMRGA